MLTISTKTDLDHTCTAQPLDSPPYTAQPLDSPPCTAHPLETPATRQPTLYSPPCTAHPLETPPTVQPTHLPVEQEWVKRKESIERVVGRDTGAICGRWEHRALVSFQYCITERQLMHPETQTPLSDHSLTIHNDHNTHSCSLHLNTSQKHLDDVCLNRSVRLDTVKNAEQYRGMHSILFSTFCDILCIYRLFTI